MLHGIQDPTKPFRNILAALLSSGTPTSFAMPIYSSHNRLLCSSYCRFQSSQANSFIVQHRLVPGRTFCAASSHSAMSKSSKSLSGMLINERRAVWGLMMIRRILYVAARVRVHDDLNEIGEIYGKNRVSFLHFYSLKSRAAFLTL